jgi:hypothetical protein
LHDFRELILKHAGTRVIVMGGGPSLAADIERIGTKPGDVVISTNAHGVDLREPDYLLAIDHTHTRARQPMGAYLRQRSTAPIISPHAFANYRLGHWPEHPRWVLSGLIAAWAGWAMGAKVVVLAGMDGYADNDYSDEARKIARDIHGPVRVASGFLSGVWPLWDPGERFGKYTPHSAIDGLRGIDGLVRVRVRKACTVGRADVAPGMELTAYRHEVHKLLRHRMVEEL